eukprot:scaffold153258_cov36-Prasinocladus_malaysianus.AAC.1
MQNDKPIISSGTCNCLLIAWPSSRAKEGFSTHLCALLGDLWIAMRTLLMRNTYQSQPRPCVPWGRYRTGTTVHGWT